MHVTLNLLKIMFFGRVELTSHMMKVPLCVLNCVFDSILDSVKRMSNFAAPQNQLGR